MIGAMLMLLFLALIVALAYFAHWMDEWTDRHQGRESQDQT